MYKLLGTTVTLILFFANGIAKGPHTCYNCIDSLDNPKERNCSSPLNVTNPYVKISQCSQTVNLLTDILGTLNEDGEMVCIKAVFGLNFNYPKPLNITGRACGPKDTTVAGEITPICQFIDMYMKELEVADLKECTTCDNDNCNGE